MAEALLVNSIYPVEYFTLPGVNQVDYPDRFWWASAQRFPRQYPGTDEYYVTAEDGGVLTQEILEIDLGRIREVNYVTFDLLRAPIDVSIEYDAISTPDRDALWTAVRPVEGLPFDDGVFFDPGSRTAWFNADYHFTTPRGSMVHTRYLRVTFTRRDEPWPTSTSQPFKWPVMVKHARIGRYIAGYGDTVGPLLTQDTPADLEAHVLATDSNNYTREIRQQFRVPQAAKRGDDVWPSILGFGLLVEVEAPPVGEGGPPPTTTDVSVGWSLWDVSEGDPPSPIRAGTYGGTYEVGTNWVNWYLDDQDPILTNPDTVYEFRAQSLNDTVVSQTYFSTRALSSTPLPGTLDFTLNDATVTTTEDLSLHLEVGSWFQTSAAPGDAFQVASFTTATEFEMAAPFPGATALGSTASRVYPLLRWQTDQYIEEADRNLVMRVWADVADEGQDILGNTYRYGVRREKAQYVVDGTRAGWMSDPVPSKDAVEALYFDLREWDTDEGNFKLRLVDGLRIRPRTPGVKMNVYYSRENLQGERPTNRTDWDYLLWSPVSQNSFTLRSNQTIEFPQPIRAAFVKLEFTDLNPLPWRVPSYPPLPPKQYRRMPTWVETQFNNSQLRNVVEDWWLRKSTPVQVAVLEEIRHPVREFEYKEREFFAALALGEVEQSQLISSSLVNTDERSVIDPVTGAKIFLHGVDKFKNTLLLSVDQESILGRMVVARFDPFASVGTTERRAGVAREAIATVSSINDRVSGAYSHIAQVPMRFNKTARHAYREDTAEFNHKAFFVGIDEVEFFRSMYSVKNDDEVIRDILYDDVLLELNTWEREATTQIADGQTLFVSYQIGTGTDYYVDEEVVLPGLTPIKLQGKGAPIANVRVYSKAGSLGNTYWQNDDWTLSHLKDENGEWTHWISRSGYTERLGVPEQPIVYVDAAIVTGVAFIPAPPTEDEAIVTGIAVISGDEGPYEPSFGSGVYGGGIYEDLTTATDDTGTATGDGVASGVENIAFSDAATSTGDAVITGDEVFEDN